VYLMAALLVFAVPLVIPRSQESLGPLVSLAHYGLPLLIAAMAVIPSDGANDSPREAIDLAYSLFVILLLAVLVLGSVALMLLKDVGYVGALLTMVFAGAAMLLLLSLAWNPSAGFSGLGAMASRYLLAVGLPLEQWLHAVTALAQRESDPIRFLDQSCHEMVARLSWITGGVWSTEGKTGAFGGNQGVEATFSQGRLVLTLYTQQAMPPALVWHFNLVAQLLADLHRAKQQEQQLRDMAYVQAIHETGARLTHDVKNLLQSLNMLIFAADVDQRDGSGRYRRLLDRQLPQIAQRLQQTMDKLGQPEMERSEMTPAAEWWRQTQERYAIEKVVFESRGDLELAKLPSELFTTALENLLQNAMNKRAVAADIVIRLTLDVEAASPTLSLCDTGAAVAADIAADIGKRPVESESGLGIGLYQVSRNAQLYRYRLELLTNRDGQVCFGLMPE
jgi:signal transduction histidine kinase